MKKLKVFLVLTLLILALGFGSFELYQYVQNKKHASISQFKTTIGQLLFRPQKEQINTTQTKEKKEEEFELYLGAENQRVNLEEVSVQKTGAGTSAELSYFQVGLGTPPQYVLAESSSYLKEISHELNSLNFTRDGFIKLFWKIRNNTKETIVLDQKLREFLNPAKAFVIDQKRQRVFKVLHDNQLIEPIANCLLTETIPPYARIECSAKLGNLSFNTPRRIRTNKQREGDRVFVYLPGARKPVKIFKDLLI